MALGLVPRRLKQGSETLHTTFLHPGHISKGTEELGSSTASFSLLTSPLCHISFFFSFLFFILFLLGVGAHSYPD